MKNSNPLGLFDDHFLLETLSKPGDPLQKLIQIKTASKNFGNKRLFGGLLQGHAVSNTV